MLFHRFRTLRARRPQALRRRPTARPGLEALEERALMTAGALDPFFNGNGKQHVAFNIDGNQFDAARAVAVDNLGRIVVAGSVQVGAEDIDFGVIRLNPNGSLDKTFSGDGLQTITFNQGGFNVDKANAVAIDNQGRIIVAGVADRIDAGNRDFAVARLKDNGNLDTDFGPLRNGRLTVAFDIGKSLGFTDDQANAVAIDSQGRIVVAGTVQINQNDFDFGVARLKDNGDIDNSFGAAAKPGRQIVEFDLGGNNVDQANAVAIDGADRVILAGSAERGLGDVDFAVARLKVNGALDSDFDTDGRQTVAFNFGQQLKDVANGVAIDGQGRIVLGGFAERASAGDTDFAMARLKTDGRLDNAFDFDGKQVAFFDIGGLKIDKANAVSVQPDGKIVAVGFATTSFNGVDFALTRLNDNGSPDTTFNGSGKQTVVFNLFGNGTDGANAVALSPDGTRIVVAGEVLATGGQTDFGVAVLDTGLVPPPSPAPPAPVPPPVPAPAPAPVRGVFAQLVKVGKAKRLFVIVRFADTGEIKTVFKSPFQKSAYNKIQVSTVDTNNDGAADAVKLTARPLGSASAKLKVRIIPV